MLRQNAAVHLVVVLRSGFAAVKKFHASPAATTVTATAETTIPITTQEAIFVLDPLSELSEVVLGESELVPSSATDGAVISLTVVVPAW